MRQLRIQRSAAIALVPGSSPVPAPGEWEDEGIPPVGGITTFAGAMREQVRGGKRVFAPGLSSRSSSKMPVGSELVGIFA